MSPVPPDTDPADRPDRRAIDASRPVTPRWVKVSGAIALLLVLVFVVVLVAGGSGQHGPGRHSGEGARPVQAAPPSAAERHTRPAGADHGAR